MNRIVLENDERDFLVWRDASGGTVEIYDIVVGSERRQGKGRQLINLLLNEHLPLGVHLVWALTRATNRIAQEFYEELGFRVVGVQRNFYKDEGLPAMVDAIMYGRDIDVTEDKLSKLETFAEEWD